MLDLNNPSINQDAWRNRIVESGEMPAKDFIAHELNARRHPDNQLAALRGSLNTLGWIARVIVSARTGKIVDGHARVAEALAKDENQLVPYDKVDLTEEEERKVLTVFDGITGMATYDTESLGVLIRSVNADDEGLQSLIYNMAESHGLSLGDDKAEGGGGDEFDATPDDGPPRTKAGDLWIIGGKHRLLCGDSTNPHHVARVLAGATPRLMTTDPPYGVEYDPSWRVDRLAAGMWKGGKMMLGKVANDDRADWSEAWHLFPGDVVYCWHAGKFAGIVQNSLEGEGFLIRSQIIWVKQHFALSRGDYHWRHEPCWYAIRKGKPSEYCGGRTQDTVWEIPNLNPLGGSGEAKFTHGTQKPLECMQRAIRNHKGDVYDPFLGSGTTLIAAHREGRKCYGLELEGKYCDIILRRAEAEGLSVEKTKEEADRRFNRGPFFFGAPVMLDKASIESWYKLRAN